MALFLPVRTKPRRRRIGRRKGATGKAQPPGCLWSSTKTLIGRADHPRYRPVRILPAARVDTPDSKQTRCTPCHFQWFTHKLLSGVGSSAAAGGGVHNLEQTYVDCAQDQWRIVSSSHHLFVAPDRTRPVAGSVTGPVTGPATGPVTLVLSHWSCHWLGICGCSEHG